MEQNYTDDTFLARWLNNDLNEEEKVAFEKTKAFQEYSKIIEKTALFEAPEFDQKSVFNAIQNKLQNKQKVRKLFPNWAYAVAASVAVLLGVYFMMPSETIYETNYGEQLAVVLPDGSKVQLNAKSTLTLDEEDWKEGQRNLTLEGEGYFVVEKGSKFTVNTKMGSVSVLGTQFNVKKTQQFFDVKCYEGKVSVVSENQNTILIPGNGFQRIEGTKGKNTTFKETSPSWVSGESTFEKAPLHVVISELEKQYKITIDHSAIDVNQLYSGSFTYKNKEIALQTVFIPLQITYVVGESGNIKLSEK